MASTTLSLHKFIPSSSRCPFLHVPTVVMRSRAHTGSTDFVSASSMSGGGSASASAAQGESDPLQILMLEDVETDAELIRAELSRADICFNASRVTSRDGFALALEARSPDLILMDYNLPAFDGSEALQMALAEHPTVPVVFVSGAIGEERGIETLKQGATDYVLKDRLSRLVPAVKRALQEAEERKARRQAEEALRTAHDRLEQKVDARTAKLRRVNDNLQREIEQRKSAERAHRESEQHLSAVIDSAIDAIISFDATLAVDLFNEAAESMLGCCAEERMQQPLHRFLADGLRAVVQQYVRTHNQSGNSSTPEAEEGGWYVSAAEGLRARRLDGTTFRVEATISSVRLPDKRRYVLILRDVEKMKKTEAHISQLESENQYLRRELESEYNFKEIVGQSRTLEAVFDAIAQVAETDTTVLVSGETGTGKELVARALHDRSARADEMLVKVNCAALPSDLIESELFGHEKGAFTGAKAQRIGRFELADGGTLFLDEVGELPMGTQAKLLRVLQEQEFERVGGQETLQVDTRILAATNRDLKAEVDAGRFRPDLYYRLHVFPISLPPLRERDGDVSLLADHFVTMFAAQTGTEITDISAGAMAILEAYDWPGNVRELANIIERAVILASGPTLRAEHVSLRGPSAFSSVPQENQSGFPSLAAAQRDHIAAALRQTGGVVGGDDGAAQLLEMNRTTLLSRMNRLGLDPATFR